MWPVKQIRQNEVLQCLFVTLLSMLSDLGHRFPFFLIMKLQYLLQSTAVRVIKAMYVQLLNILLRTG